MGTIYSATGKGQTRGAASQRDAAICFLAALVFVMSGEKGSYSGKPCDVVSANRDGYAARGFEKSSVSCYNMPT